MRFYWRVRCAWSITFDTSCATLLQRFFHSQPAPEPELCFLEGQTLFGDNIEDEWFIVYLLFELTRRIGTLVAQARRGTHVHSTEQHRCMTGTASFC